MLGSSQTFSREKAASKSGKTQPLLKLLLSCQTDVIHPGGIFSQWTWKLFHQISEDVSGMNNPRMSAEKKPKRSTNIKMQECQRKEEAKDVSRTKSKIKLKRKMCMIIIRWCPRELNSDFCMFSLLLILRLQPSTLLMVFEIIEVQKEIHQTVKEPFRNVLGTLGSLSGTQMWYASLG